MPTYRSKICTAKASYRIKIDYPYIPSILYDIMVRIKTIKFLDWFWAIWIV